MRASNIWFMLLFKTKCHPSEQSSYSKVRHSLIFLIFILSSLTQTPLNACSSVTAYHPAMHVKMPDFNKLAKRKPASIVGACTTFTPTDATFADEAAPVHDEGCPHQPGTESLKETSPSRRTQPQVRIPSIWSVYLPLRCLLRVQVRR